MKEIPFSIPVSGVVRIDGNSVTIVVNRASTHIQLETGSESPGRMVFETGTNTFDILLESAREYIRRKTYNRFTVTDLFDIAREKYPDLKKRSYVARITGATPNHPSYKHQVSRRDYFSRIAPGIYSLENKYMPENAKQNVLRVATEISPSPSNRKDNSNCG